MILIKLINRDGRVVRQCDYRCYDAIGNICHCICQGHNHKVGKKQAVNNTSLLFGHGEKDLTGTMLFYSKEKQLPLPFTTFGYGGVKGMSNLISVKVIKKSKVERKCCMCIKIIKPGSKLYQLYGSAMKGEKPYIIYECVKCVDKFHATHPKFVKATGRSS